MTTLPPAQSAEPGDAWPDAARGGAAPFPAIGSVPSAGPPTIAGTQEERPGRPILIADDDPTSLALIEACLDALLLANPRCLARDGQQALDVLTECAAGRRRCPALVLLDVQMPGRSGPEVLAWIRQTPALEQVPVVLLTADSSRDSIRDAYAAGATSYLVKPVGFGALTDVVRGLKAPWMLA